MQDRSLVALLREQEDDFHRRHIPCLSTKHFLNGPRPTRLPSMENFVLDISDGGQEIDPLIHTRRLSGKGIMLSQPSALKPLPTSPVKDADRASDAKGIGVLSSLQPTDSPSASASSLKSDSRHEELQDFFQKVATLLVADPGVSVQAAIRQQLARTQFEFRVKGASVHHDGRILRLVPSDGGAQPLALEFEDSASVDQWKAALYQSGAERTSAGLRIASNVLELVGNTPLLYLNKVTEGSVAKVAVKLEFFNPVCSVKDRLALGIIRDLEAAGKIIPGKTVLVEATSGNTGIGVSAMAIHRGYKVILCMPETMSLERRTLLKAFGAEIVLTPGARGMKGAVLKAEQIVKSNPDAVLTAQFETASNAKIHRETTGPEIWRDTNGTVDIFVSGVGTGGTITGVAEYLKSKGSKCRIVAVEPAESPILSGGKPGPHKIQGIGAGFVPQVLRKELIDEVVQVTSEDALQMAGRLPREEGLLTGISSGAAVYAAVQLSQRPENIGKLIVAIVPSFGERYLSTPLFSATRDAAAALPTTPIDD